MHLRRAPVRAVHPSGLFQYTLRRVTVRILAEKLCLLAGPKLGNAGTPKIFFLDSNAKERAPKGRCHARGV